MDMTMQVIVNLTLKATLMDWHMGQDTVILRKHSPQTNLLEMLVENWVLTVVVVAQEQALLTIQATQDHISLIGRTKVNITQMVYDIVGANYSVPILDHEFIHFLQIMEGPNELIIAILKGQDVSVVPVSVGDNKDIPHYLLSE